MRPFWLLTAALFSIILMTDSCKNEPKTPVKPVASIAPSVAVTPNLQYTDVHCWIENGIFFVIGICENNGGEWQKIALKVTPTDKKGQDLAMTKDQSPIVALVSAAVPPKGRSSFFAGWPLETFRGSTPDSCRLEGASATVVPAGPILLVEQQSGVRMYNHKSGGDPAPSSEYAWQMSAILNNPLQQPAAHPRMELLLYGKDKRLWLSFLINPEDAALKQGIKLTEERSGPLAGQEKRLYSWFVTYEGLPQALQKHKIGRTEMLGFDAR